MIQVKSFDIGKDKEFNEFVKNNPPRGEHGIKYAGEKIMVFYEVGVGMTKEEKISSLEIDLRGHAEKILQYTKQLKVSEAILAGLEKGQVGRSEFETSVKADGRMLAIEIMKEKATQDLIAELQKEND